MDLDFRDAPKYTFSANEIRTYSDCARKRYYSSRDCLAIVSSTINSKLAVGSMIHRALQHYYTEVQKVLYEWQIDFPTVDNVREALEYVEQFQLSDDFEDEKTYEAVMQSYLDQFVEDLVAYEVLECEHEFSMDNWPIDNVRYHGQIDMIVRDRRSGHIKFFEHKTCKEFRPEIYNRFDIQLHIYGEFGERYASQLRTEFDGMVLNELKKAKTFLGCANHRMYYKYSADERTMFENWLARKTAGAVSATENEMHEPCNNYMICRMCDYAPICLKYGYEQPKSTSSIVEDRQLGELYKHNPREEVK